MSQTHTISPDVIASKAREIERVQKELHDAELAKAEADRVHNTTRVKLDNLRIEFTRMCKPHLDKNTLESHT